MAIRYELRFIFIFFAYEYPIVPAPLLKDYPLSIELLWHLYQKAINWPYICGSTFRILILFHWSVCLSFHNTYGLNDCSFIMNCEARQWALLPCPFSKWFWLFWALWFFIIFRIHFSISTKKKKKVCWQFDLDCVESIDQFWETWQQY